LEVLPECRRNPEELCKNLPGNGEVFFIFTVMEIRELYRLYLDHPHILTDSREARENSIFFGLKGEHYDGSLYADQALAGGCSFAVVDNPQVVDKPGIIRVENSLSTLQKLASWHRQQLDVPIIGITGSNGKTTTKELISSLLSTQYSVYSTRGNLNNHIGVPLTLLSFDKGMEIGIVEMGANHIGEIGLLCGLARPDYGLITNVGHAHLEGFGSFEGVKQAKSELYRFLEESGGLIFCNGGDAELRNLVSELEAGVSYYGDSEKSLVKGEITGSDPFLNMNILLREGEVFEIRTGLVGSYNSTNILAAVAIADHFRIRPENMETKLNGWSLSNMRSEFLDTGRNTLILDAYNANPTSMMAALENFNRMDHPDKVLILGDMLELGDESEREHASVVRYIEEAVYSEVFLVGPIFNKLPGKPQDIYTFANVEEMSGWLQRNPLKNRLILLKGSRGIGLESLKDRL
jgi:UDP-N-acetylmuramoyl-tripeptide--D-alanyl-D-alanine ligase